MLISPAQDLDTQLLFIQSQKLSFFLRTFNNKFRQSIIRVLEEHNKLSVTEILVKIRQLQSVTSQHLAVLRRTGIVKTSRTGKKIYYELNHERLSQINDLINALSAGIPVQEFLSNESLVKASEQN